MIDDLDHRIVRKRIRYERLRILFWTVVGFLIVAFGVGMIEISIQIAETQRTIEACTVPGQSCFDDGQERLKTAIEQIEANQAKVAQEGSVPGLQNLEYTRVNSYNIRQICIALKLECKDLPPEETP